MCAQTATFGADTRRRWCATTVASAANQLLAANLLTTSYSQVIPSAQVMLAGCVYTMTATYTLQ